MDVARLNFSHGTLEEHAEVIANVRAASERHNRPVAVLQDLGGNKFRLGNMAEAIQLNFRRPQFPSSTSRQLRVSRAAAVSRSRRSCAACARATWCIFPTAPCAWKSWT